MKIRLILTLATALAVATPLTVQAQGAAKTVPLKIAPKTTSTTVNGAVKGAETIDYVIGGKQGQTISVLIKPSGPPAYFNVMAKGADEAMYNGSIDGSSFSGLLPKTGDYIIHVYLMPKEAKSGTPAPFSLRASVID